MKQEKNNEILLRIDEVGRIVIPKKYRDTLSINNVVAMSIENDSLKISKYNDIDYFERIYNFCKVWVDSYTKNTILITDLSEILYMLGSEKNTIRSKSINNEIFKIIRSNDLSFDCIENYELFKNFKKVDCDIVSIRKNNLHIGSVIIFGDCNSKDRGKFFFNVINKN